MKKILAIVLAMMLVISLGVNAMAAEVNEDGGTSTGNVDITVIPFTDEVYAVTINWTNLIFTYEFEDWNTTDHEYVGDWVNDTATITVTNDSNVSIVATPDAPVDKTADGVTVTVDTNPKTLRIAENGSFSVTVGGKPDNRQATYTTATIKITITKA